MVVVKVVVAMVIMVVVLEVVAVLVQGGTTWYDEWYSNTNSGIGDSVLFDADALKVIVAKFASKLKLRCLCPVE